MEGVNVSACTSHMTLGINARVPQHGITLRGKLGGRSYKHRSDSSTDLISNKNSKNKWRN
ncbi:hypothetical protein BpHYR1_044634 [Brachionus plicatilis]|uniref:Uncharacterized protein n=1 Tax=Brachionus plicatilis TaxID=10195 RepID=A0A3M7PPF6_BRAPC|nr:hypothetical protein BpHYR1_044634 [Brachionus plicatilis]